MKNLIMKRTPKMKVHSIRIILKERYGEEYASILKKILKFNPVKRTDFLELE